VPGGRNLRRIPVDMRTHDADAGRKGGFQAPRRAGADIVRVPMRAVLVHQVDSVEQAVDPRRPGLPYAADRVGLVQMDVAIGEKRRDVPATICLRRHKRGDFAVLDSQVMVPRKARNRDAGQNDGCGCFAHVHDSRRISLSCQRPRTRRDSQLVARKITMPSSDTRKSAANMRGISLRKLDSRMREARPVLWPAVPATNSATTAPISDRPPAIFSAAMK